MKNAYPSTRTLVLVWLVLISATVITMLAGKVTQVTSIGSLWAVLLLLVTWVKARLILAWFLDLKSATGGWNLLFTLLVSLILILVLGFYFV